MNIDNLKSEIEHECQTACWQAIAAPDGGNYLEAKAKVDGIFLGAVATLKAMGFNVIEGEEAEVLRQVTNQWTKKITDAYFGMGEK